MLSLPPNSYPVLSPRAFATQGEPQGPRAAASPQNFLEMQDLGPTSIYVLIRLYNQNREIPKEEPCGLRGTALEDTAQRVIKGGTFRFQ